MSGRQPPRDPSARRLRRVLCVWSGLPMSERRILRGRLRRPEGEGSPAEDRVVEIEPGALSGLFAAPKWMQDLGFSAWLLVGVAAALVGTVWILSLTHTIVMPV